MTRHLTSLLDLSPAETGRVLDLADEVKKSPGKYTSGLAGKSIAMIFAKQSTRTRISFEVGIHQLGGQALALSTGGGTGMQMGRGETIHDTAKVLSRYLSAIVIRTFEQAEVDGLAEHGSIPVVNALTDLYHPCQALADLQTVRARLGALPGVRMAYVGDGNNVAHSLLRAGALAGMHLTVVTPPGHEPDPAVVAAAERRAEDSGATVAVTTDATVGVKDAQVVYTDVWASMGQEDEHAARVARFGSYQVNADLLALAAPGAIVLHCLPAHRGEEISADVIDGPQSAVWDQAENRLHAQKALLELLLDDGTTP
jgi:ornithine carbamoyltransferase